MGSHRPQPDMMTARRDRCSDGSGSQALGIFLSWLLWLPEDADPAIAARTEIDRIDRLVGGNATTAELRDLLHALCQGRGLN
jgi:hypothetical protein